MRGAALYLLTLILELPGTALRYVLFGFIALILASAIPGLDDPDTLAGPIAFAAAVGPLVWSVCALAVPSPGLWWRWRSGGRKPSNREREAYEEALALLEERGDHDLRPPHRWFVLDVEDAQAAVRGDALMVSRGLVQHGDANLTAVLAHELGHTTSLDGRLTEALNRLVLWGDPLGPPKPAVTVGGDPFIMLAWGITSYLSSLMRGFWRVVLYVAGGALSQLLLRRVWAAHWRRREYVADAFATRLGQREELASFLESHALFFDLPVPFLWASAEPHPPVELRIDKLQQSGPVG